MNLHGIVTPAISVVNPPTLISIRVSTGYTTGPDGKRVPTYAAGVSVWAQSQPLEYNDIQMADSMQIQGERKKIYIPGQISGLVREMNKGGDLVTYPNGDVWKVAFISEAWPDWTTAVLTLQDLK